MLWLVRAVLRHAEVVVPPCGIGQHDADLFLVQTRDLFVELLGQTIDSWPTFPAEGTIADGLTAGHFDSNAAATAAYACGFMMRSCSSRRFDLLTSW